jgi:hypothetical protein
MFVFRLVDIANARRSTKVPPMVVSLCGNARARGLEQPDDRRGRRRKSVKIAHLWMCGSSCKTTFSNELWISRWPL